MSPILLILPVKFTFCVPQGPWSEDTLQGRGKHRLPFKLFTLLFYLGAVTFHP